MCSRWQTPSLVIFTTHNNFLNSAVLADNKTLPGRSCCANTACLFLLSSTGLSTTNTTVQSAYTKVTANVNNNVDRTMPTDYLSNKKHLYSNTAKHRHGVLTAPRYSKVAVARQLPLTAVLTAAGDANDYQALIIGHWFSGTGFRMMIIGH